MSLHYLVKCKMLVVAVMLGFVSVSAIDLLEKETIIYRTSSVASKFARFESS